MGSRLCQEIQPMIRRTCPRGLVNLVIRRRISNPLPQSTVPVFYSRPGNNVRPLIFRAGVQLRVDARILRCRKSNIDNGILAPHVTDFDIYFVGRATNHHESSIPRPYASIHTIYLFILPNTNWPPKITSRTCFFLHVSPPHAVRF